VVCIHMTHDKDQQWAVVKVIMEVQVSQKVKNFLNGSATILHKMDYAP